MFGNKYRVPHHIRFFLFTYFLGLCVFMALRFLLLITNIGNGAMSFSDIVLLPEAFFNGFRFDTSISCYILSIPFIISSLGSMFRPLRRGSIEIAFYLLLLLYCIAIFICCADIPYFNHFSCRINMAALNWADSPLFMVKMVLGTFSFWIYLVPLFLLTRWFYRKLEFEKQIAVSGMKENRSFFSFNSFLYLLLIAPLLFLGIRGRIAQKSPMLTGTAYYCDNNFLNQLGLNAVFTFMHSVVESSLPKNSRLNLMEDKEAIENAKKFLNSGQEELSPVARKVIPAGPEHKMNVVVVIMEGMSRFNMGSYDGNDTITPVLHSLKKRSLWFENIFTQGIHTYNGIYSTLFSYPALLGRHCMQDIPAHKYHSMPQVFKEQGYATNFFITHDGEYDNARGFLTANGFDRVYAEADYPAEKVLSTLGVPDDYLFDFSIPKMNELASAGKNFFCGFMTGSNHRPIVIPDWVNRKFFSPEEHERIVQYSDWAIGEFLRKASEQSWYTNTIFVFVADHGANWQHTYDMPIAFHHTPLIIYAPGLELEPATYDCFGGQIDIFPTLMGLMNLPYTNNTMGIDLLKEKRPYAYFTADDKIGCIDKDFYFIHRMNGVESLYKYADLSKDNYLDQYRSRADSMRTYTFSMLQATQWIVEKEKFSKK